MERCTYINFVIVHKRRAEIDKRFIASDDDRKKQREASVALLSKVESPIAVARSTGAKRTTVRRLKREIECGDNEVLAKMLDPQINRAGLRTVLSLDKDALIKKRINYAATHGFSLDQLMLKRVMALITADGRKTFRSATGVQSNDDIRNYRAQNRDITFRKAENKTASKLHAER